MLQNEQPFMMLKLGDYDNEWMKLKSCMKKWGFVFQVMFGCGTLGHEGESHKKT